jgi:farnesyl-diphosphate farnesyltransferase
MDLRAGGGPLSADLDTLLEKSSRTFALSIPLLPEPTRRAVSVAYLLFRIADTFEDATLWSPERRIAALREFSFLAREPSEEKARADAALWLASPPCEHSGYLELLRETPGVIAHFLLLPPGISEAIRVSVTASAEGMARFVGRMTGAGDLRLKDMDDLRDYCHVVAGLVGEMLTEIFLFERPALDGAASFLRARAAPFGEGLQLVNILKDAGADGAEGRSYLPAGVERSDVFALARRDLATAAEYVRALRDSDAPSGIVGFAALPVELAWATLDRVESRGPGSKVPRREVFRIVSRLKRDLDRNRHAVRPR